MPPKLQEIEARYHGERFRFGSCFVGDAHLCNGSIQSAKAAGVLQQFIAIKGDAEPDELSRDATYRFYGRWSSYTNRRTGLTEKQFHFQTFVMAASHDREGVISYLEQAGKGNGLGRATATKAWNIWGSDTIKIVRDDPNELRKINSRLTEDGLAHIKAKLDRQAATEAATIDITGLLHGRGFPKTTARKAILKWGNCAATIIRRDPYSLMAFRGCGFRLTDALYLELGLPRDRLRRQALCAWYAVASNTEGHTWYPVELASRAVQAAIGPSANPLRAITLAKRLGQLSPDHYGALATIRTDGADGPITSDGKRLWVSEGKAAASESRLASMVATAIREPITHWIDPSIIKGIDDHQREKLGQAIQTAFAILGGSPGTGKTFSTAMLIRTLLKKGMSPDDIAIGCPTGKAAVRITEAMQAAGLRMRARTWHSLLGVSESDNEGGGWSFQHNEFNPWRFRIIVGDESSMLDTSLMCSIMKARPRGCHVLLVGDVNQLPPVGSGAPFRDLINSQMCGYGELIEIKRNSGGIVEACASIRDSEPWSAGDNLVIDESPDQVQAMLDHLDRSGVDPVWDCQVLVAVNAKSQLSRKTINQRLQSELNSNPTIKGTPFRLDDKIVCLKNGWYRSPTEDNEEIYIANGEIGRVVEVEPKSLIVELDLRTVRVPLGKASDDDNDDGEEKSSTGCSWDLAYGLSVHKSQGSEFPIAIVMLDEYPGARMVCSREWLYTGISRAKQKCILIGKKETADAMCRRVAIGKRKTFLRELVQLKAAESFMEDI